MVPTIIKELNEFIVKFEKTANSVVKLVNTLAGALLEVKLASGALMGSLHVKYSAAVRLRAVVLFHRTSRLKRTHSLDPLTLSGQSRLLANTLQLSSFLWSHLPVQTDHDLVFLQFGKADGSALAADEVDWLLKKETVKSTDHKLAHTLAHLLKSTPTGLKAR